MFAFGDDCIAVKSEYTVGNGLIEAFILGSGEQFWGGAKTAKEQNELMVQPLEIVDAVEVKHGHNLKDYDSAFECSVCGWEDWDTLTADTSKYNYCPNCGAKMDGDGNG